MTDPVMWFFIVVICASSLWLRRSKRRSAAEVGNVATSLGLLGTFVGIAIALIAFDVDNVSESVPLLMSGMKTAFLTSVCGVAVAVGLRLWEFRGAPPRREAGPAGATAEDVIAAIEAGNETLERLVNSIGGENDSSLLMQVTVLRSNMNDGIKKVRKDLRKFSETLAENNMSAVTDALTAVVKDFNEKLNAQFGENFAKLNEAVAALLTWQENYRLQVEASEARLEALIKASKALPDAFEEVGAKLADVASKVKEVEQALQATSLQVASLVQSHGNMEAVVKTAGTVVSTLDGHTTSLQAATAQLEALADGSKGAANSLAGVAAGVQSTLDAIKAQQAAAMTQLAQDLRSSQAKNDAAIQQQVAELDRALGEALTKSLESLAGQLATLSAQFVEDYRPLTEALRRVVRIAKDLDES